MNILLTLDSGLGANLGPNFNLTSNSGHTVTPNTATRAELIAGKSITVSPDGATNIFVTSTGVCTNTLVLNIAGITTSTTTSTTSTSTTAAPTTSTTSTSTTSTSTSTSTTTLAAIPVTLAYSNVDGPTACYKFTAPIPDTATYYLQPGSTLADGNSLYVDDVYTNIVADGFYSNGVDLWEVNAATSGGVLSNGTPCPQTTTTTTSTSTTSTSTSTTSTSTSTSTTTAAPTTTTTTAAPTTTTTTVGTTTSTTTLPGDTTTSTTTQAPTTTTTTAAPTTTTTTAAPTTTTTTIAPNSVLITPDSYAGTTTSCAATATLEVYYLGTLGDGITLYENSGLTTLFDGDGDFYKIGSNDVGRINGSGIISNYTNCSTTTTTTAAPTTTTTTTAGATVDITITNASLDVPVGSMTINGANVDWVGYGPDFVLSASDNGSFTSTQTGTQDVVIGYGGHIPGQRITFYDSNNSATCQTLNGSVGTFTITGATITAGTTISVVVEDGICP